MRSAQGDGDGFDEEIANFAGVAEADFFFHRVDVDVHQFGFALDKEVADGMASAGELALVGLA